MKRKRQPVEFNDVRRAIDQKDRQAAERLMTPAEREQAQKDAQRKKVTYELDTTVVELIGQIAKAIGTSQAGVVNLFLAQALRDYADGELDFKDCLVPSRSPRFQWLVQIRVNGLRDAVTARIFEGDSVQE